MRGASLSDAHLGFRAFSATQDGRNLRELDTEKAWWQAINAILDEHERESIQLVTMAGDLVHHPRVSDFAKKALIDGVRLLVDAGIPVVVLQGNHDAGKTADVLTPLKLAEDSRDHLYVVTTPERVLLGLQGGTTVSVSCFPYVVMGDGKPYKLEPAKDADVNILVAHAAVKADRGGDLLPHFYGAGDQALDIAQHADDWDVIAVGDYHEFKRLHPKALAFYSGSLERTSTNIWNEDKPKGWVLWDTDDVRMEFHEVDTRPVVETDLSDALTNGLRIVDHTAESVNEAMAQILTGDVPEIFHGHAPIVRLTVPEFPREEKAGIDWALVRRLKSECAHFELRLQYAKPPAVNLVQQDEGRPKVLTVGESAKTFFSNENEHVRRLAMKFLGVGS